MNNSGALLTGLRLAMASVVMAACAPSARESGGIPTGGGPGRVATARPAATPAPITPAPAPSRAPATAGSTNATSSEWPPPTTAGGEAAVAHDTFPAPAVRSGADASLDAGVGEPLAIAIPAIGVTSFLVPAGTLEDGSIAVPADPAVAGWFTGARRPGDRGPAVIVGHVDSKSGPGVFWRLHELPVGSTVTVTTTTGPVEFVVEAVQRYPKDQFPTDAVYGAVPRPALRLITCGGSFDRSSGHYRDNVVAYLVSAAA